MTIQNEHLEHRINQMLLSDSDLSSQRVNVIANGGVVTLKGNVQSFRRKLAAQELAMADEDVHEVLNEIVVSTPTDHTPAMLAETVNRLLDAADGLSNESIMIASSENAVTLSGYVQEEFEKIRVEDIARSVDGVEAVTSLLIVNPDEVSSNREHCEKILTSISKIIGLPSDKIRLTVVNEAARLSGQVESLWMKEAAATAVRSFGILTLANDIIVKV